MSQGTSRSPLTDAQLRASAVSVTGPLTDVQLRSDPVSISFADTVQLDAFGRLRVSDAYTLFDSQQEYGLDTLRTWSATANGVMATLSSNGSAVSGSNAVGPTDSSTRMTPITVSNTSGEYAVLQSKSYARYIPGKSHLVLITGIFSPGTVPNCDSRVGYFDAANGIFLKVTNGVNSVVRRTSTSGGVADTEVLQSAWNIDKLDGTGVSGLTLDTTKTNILSIQAQWLGVGCVVIGFDINGQLYPVHQFLNANNLVIPYTQSFNLPIRLELRNSGTSTGTPTIQFICCSVQTEGGQAARGYPMTAPASITSTAVTTRRPILSIRPKATYNGRTNRGHIDDMQVYLKAITNDALYEVIIGGALTGAAFTSVNASSIAEVDTAATSITGGLPIYAGFVISGSGSKAEITGATVDPRNPLTISQIDALAVTQTPVTIVCTSVSGTSNIAAGMNWHELTI